MITVVIGQVGVVTNFYVLLSDGVTPATAEAGNQPEVSINGASFGPTGIGVLVAVGFGRYTATIDPGIIVTAGDILLTRYRGIITLESEGDSFQVIDPTTLLPFPTTTAINVLSYVDLNQANYYFTNRLNSKSWLKSTSQDQLNSLRQATKIIDRLNFVGTQTNVAQLLQFPRGGDTVVPADIQFACMEIAIRLLDGVDPELEAEAIMAESHGFGNVKAAYNRKYVPDHLLAGIPSVTAWGYLLPYLADPRTLIMSRVT